MNQYCDAWFWRVMAQAEGERRYRELARTNGGSRHAGLASLIVLPLLRRAGLAEQPVEEAAAREGCACGGEDEFAYREPVLDDRGEWVLRCTGCGHLDHLRWLSDESRPLVLGLARRERRLRMRKEP